MCLDDSVMSAIEKDWMSEKLKYLNADIEDKRRHYKCKRYFTLDEIATLAEEGRNSFCWLKFFSRSKREFPVREDLNKKVSIFKGDITSLEIDAIVNAANWELGGGEGVDGSIHSAAGFELLQGECRFIGSCPVGSAVMTGGYKLPAKYVIHAVGPVGEKPQVLTCCYQQSLKLTVENNLRSVAFPCISTGTFRYPNKGAAHVALRTTRQFLEVNGDHLERVIFCLFSPVDVNCYENLLPVYFPIKEPC